MTVEVRLRPEAERDLVDAAGCYEQQRAGLGQQFLDEIQTVLSFIAEMPLAIPSRTSNSTTGLNAAFFHSGFFIASSAIKL
jgi:plasmid stabilization system protein ParE